ncbi:MAG: hypothetical protein BIFFINMI_01467 [Phycisphaerae bacterium]|nr:hypothetical protein [Phycisphaerae bacterium]
MTEPSSMTSRQRVLAAVEHRRPDRVPIGPRFCPEVLAALRSRLGLADDAAVLEWCGYDFAGVRPEFRRTASPIHYADPTVEVTADGLYLDIYRVPFKVVRTAFGSYVDLAGRPPLAAARTAADIDAHPWPSPDDWDCGRIAADLADGRDKATAGHSRGFFEIAHFVRGMDLFLADLAGEPEMACRLMDRIIDFLLVRARRTLQAGGGQFVIFEYNDDVASQRGLLISPAMWRRHIRPRVARFCDLFRSFGAKVRYHCCGSVRAIIPDLIEIGVEILNPVQPLAEGMDPFELKREFGRELTFHGGLDIQDFLIHATPQQVADHTRRMIDQIGCDGGFILGGSHNLQADTPVENVVAMIEAARG